MTEPGRAEASASGGLPLREDARQLIDARAEELRLDLIQEAARFARNGGAPEVFPAYARLAIDNLATETRKAIGVAGWLAGGAVGGAISLAASDDPPVLLWVFVLVLALLAAVLYGQVFSNEIRRWLDRVDKRWSGSR